jgi:predicted NACHT family NTPase
MNAKKILSRRCNDNTTHLFKQFLRIVEELKRDHDESYRKLRENLPSEYSSILNVADYFDHSKMAYIRKKILDLGNETMRSSDSELDNFTVSFVFKD